MPLFNLFMLFTLSVIFLGLFTYQSVFQKNIKSRHFVFLLRIVIAYVITMPASMGAIVVDSFDKE